MKVENNLTDKAYNLILDKITTAEYKPGTKISEQGLVSDLNIGRTPVREALLRLRQRNLINVIPQSGTYISKIDLREVLDARFIRKSVEIQIMEQAAKQQISDSEFVLLEMNLQNQYRSNMINNFSLFLSLDDEFHYTFYRLTDHTQIWNWIQTIKTAFDRYRYLSLKVEEISWENFIDDHKKILKAVRDHNPTLAGKYTAEHLNLALEEYKMVVDKFPDYFTNVENKTLPA